LPAPHCVQLVLPVADE
jgi:hypothetical protein